LTLLPLAAKRRGAAPCHGHVTRKGEKGTFRQGGEGKEKKIGGYFLAFDFRGGGGGGLLVLTTLKKQLT